MEEKKFFTLEEANRLLPKVASIVEAIVILWKSMTQKEHEVSAIGKKREGNGGGSAGSDYIIEYASLEGRINMLQEMGILLKDLNMGLIDFPHIREGREVYLCWKLGENKIEYWHEIEAGYTGRQQL